MKKQFMPFVLVIALTASLPSLVFAVDTLKAPVFKSPESFATKMPGDETPEALKSPASNALNAYAIMLDAIAQEYSDNPIIISGTAMVPVKDFYNSLGLDVAWSDFRKEITISNDSDAFADTVTVVLKTNSVTLLINNKLHIMPNKMTIINGKAFAPIKSLGEAFGMNVSWNEADRQVILTSPTVIATPAKSSDSDMSEFLSYEKAVTQGIRKSPTYQSALLSSDKAKKRNEELYVDGTTYNLTLIRTKQDLQLYDTWAEKLITITSEQVANSVKNQMDDLSLMFVQKKNQENQIDFLTEKLRIENLKYSFGSSSLQSLQSIQDEYNMAVQNLVIMDQNISTAYVKLNQTLGNPADYHNRLEYKVDYSPMEKVDIDKKILRAEYQDPYIWYAAQNVESKEFALIAYEYNAGGQSWTLTSMDLTEAKKNLNDAKTALAGVIRERYNSLLQIEENIKLLEINLEKAKDSVSFIRLQYDLGYATKLQLEEALQSLPGIEYQIRSLKQQHEQLKMLFEKPYLAPTYFSAGG